MSDSYSYDDSKQSDNGSFTDKQFQQFRCPQQLLLLPLHANFAIKNDDACPDPRICLHNPCPANWLIVIEHHDQPIFPAGKAQGVDAVVNQGVTNPGVGHDA